MSQVNPEHHRDVHRRNSLTTDLFITVNDFELNFIPKESPDVQSQARSNWYSTLGPHRGHEGRNDLQIKEPSKFTAN